MALDALTAGLFSPTIAWNTSKRRIVEQMTEVERKAIARRTTHNLRERSPEIRRYQENEATTRQRCAKLLFTQELVNADLLSDDEVTKFKRMARIGHAQIKHHGDTAAFFQNEAGYRICSLCYLAPSEALEQAKTLLDDLEILAGRQKSMFHALQLYDLIGVLTKRASKYPDFDSDPLLAKYQKYLVEYTTGIDAALKQCEQRISSQSVAAYLENRIAEHPTMIDKRHLNMQMFSTVRTCFETLNREISSQLAELVLPVLDEHPDFMLQAV